MIVFLPNKVNKYYILGIFSIIFFRESYTQNNFELYNFNKSNSTFDLMLSTDEIFLNAYQPLIKRDIASFLLRHESIFDLNAIKRKQTQFNLEKLYPELGPISIDSITAPWYLYHYRSDNYNLYLQPILGVEYTKSSQGYSFYRFNGVNIFGNFANNISYQFSFQDNFLKGSAFDAKRDFSPLKAFDERQTNNDFFDGGIFEGYISYNFGFGDISAGKYSPIIGYNRYHSIIMSDNAPSFPQISLNINFTDWLKFHYFHGWLKSGIEDSMLTYKTLWGKYDRKQYRSKYIANHSIEAKILNNLSITLGESIIYSDTDIQLLYLLPISFFHAADRYYSSNNDGSSTSYGGNSQIFSSIQYKPAKGLLINGTLLIDEISLTNIFDKNNSRNKIAYQFGVDFENPLVENNYLTLEYSRMLPWVYTNFIQTQTYENDGYSLGHWLGQNADELLIGSYLYVLKNFKISIFYSHVRKGGLDSIYLGYEDWQRAFLYNKQFSKSNLSFSFEFELIHNLYLFTSYAFIWENNYSLNKMREKISQIMFSARYRYF